MLYETNLYIVAEVVVLCLCPSILINPGYGSISLEHGSSTVATTETKTKVLDCAVKGYEIILHVSCIKLVYKCVLYVHVQYY